MPGFFAFRDGAVGRCVRSERVAETRDRELRRPVSGRFSDALSASRTVAPTTCLNHTLGVAAPPLLLLQP
jgi:hypothetical protein